MTPERWRQINQLFHSALEREPAKRAAFLDEACAGDEPLRREIESLLASHEGAESFIETPASDVAAELLSQGQNRLEMGQKLGHYKVLSLLGTGGMGEVYLAEDPRLNRLIALKLLPVQFTIDSERVRRFELEARSASGLNHPNILTIYEIGRADSTNFIATEFIDGVTLRELMASRTLKLGEALDIAAQIASALSAAHAAGIVHRDIKPENVMIRRDGFVKVLDFGLAKLTLKQAGTVDSEATTLSMGRTNSGMVMGTVKYMSPEQAWGEAVDERADIWSLGVVLYEMLTGRVPFEGETTGRVLTTILESEPLPLAHYREVPAELERIVTKALRKEKEERYQTVEGLLADLKELKDNLAFGDRLEKSFGHGDKATEVLRATTGARVKQTAETQHDFSQKIKRHKSLAALVLTASVLIASLIGFFVWKSRQVQTETVKFLRPTQITTWTSLDIYPAFSPDGNSIAYSSDHNGSFEIYVKPLAASANEIQLTSDGQQNFQPAFSPDGKFIAFHSKTRGGIWVIPAAGGKTKQLTSFGSRPAWSPDGSLIAFQSNPVIDLGAGAPPAVPPSTIWTIHALGGEPTQLTQAGNPAGGHGSPAWSPDGKRIVFCTSGFAEGPVWTISSTGGDLKQVARGYLVDAVYAPDGESIYYGSNYGLWKIRVSPATGAPLGEPVELANTSPARLRHFAVSADGKRIAYAPLSIASNLLSVPISPASNEATGADLAPLTQNRRFRNAFPFFSPDGRKIAYQSFNVGGESNIWQMDADGKNDGQITTEGGFCPSWFPDGEQILFSSNRQGQWKAWVTNLNSGQDKLLLDFGEDDVQYLQLSPDGRQIVFNSNKSGTINIAVILTTGGRARQLTFDKELAGFACWSPDGKTLAFEIKRGDDTHIAIMPSSGGEITQLTFDKGQSWPHSFSPDGDKIVFAGFRNGVWNLYWVSRSTKQQKQLTSYTKLNSYVRYPAWSPSGNQIAYEYAETTGNIWIADLK